MVKVKMFLCACLCVLAVLATPAKGDTIIVTKKHGSILWKLSDLIVYGDPNDPDPDTGKTKKKVILKPNDDSDDQEMSLNDSRMFDVDFEIKKYAISETYKYGKFSTEGPAGRYNVKIIVPKKLEEPKEPKEPKKKKRVGIRDPDGQQKVVLAIDGAVAPLEPPPEGTILAFIEGHNELMPGWFVGTGIDFEIGEVTGAYTGIVEVFSTAFEVTLFDFYPPDGAVDIPLDADLCWPKSEEAESYDVYFGTNFDHVKYGRRGTFIGSQTARCYDPGTLEPCYDYFWKIEPVIEEEEEEEEPPIIVDSVITTGDVRIYADMYIGDVWSFTTAGRKATNPYPVDGAIHVDPNVILSWTPGCLAAFHDVYFGIDFYAVANADTSDTTGIYRARLDANSYDPGGLEPGTAYYWKIEGVNEPTPDSPWQGEIWSFMTADYLVLDGMESYTDDLGNRIFETWIDGLGYTDPLNLYHIGNMTGSRVYIDSVNVHEGTQSMRADYDNGGSIEPEPWPPQDPNRDPYDPPPDPNSDPNKPTIRKAFYSEAERTFDTPQDWARCGVTALSLWSYGDPSNDPEPMYVAVEDTTGMSAVVVHDNPAAAQTDTWTEWSIDLRQFADQGMNLADVSNIAIGFGDRDNPQPGGTGTVYFDDITLGTGPCPIAGDSDKCDCNCPKLEDLKEFASDDWLDERWDEVNVKKLKCYEVAENFAKRWNESICCEKTKMTTVNLFCLDENGKEIEPGHTICKVTLCDDKTYYVDQCRIRDGGVYEATTENAKEIMEYYDPERCEHGVKEVPNHTKVKR